MSIEQYLKEIKQKYKTGEAGELSYRTPLENLIKNIKKLECISEPKHRECGNPDCLIQSKEGLTIGYIETKDLTEDLDHSKHKEQFGRYLKALDNLIITNYLEFQFYKNSELDETIKIASLDSGKIVEKKENWEKLFTKIEEFCNSPLEITSYQELAHKMAYKTHLLRRTVLKILKSTEPSQSITTLFNLFRETLLSDISEPDFADIYAQTLSYGLFVARIHSQTAEQFSKEKATSLIPSSSPFLKKLFEQVTGSSLDKRLELPFDNLVSLLRPAAINQLISDLSKKDQDQDASIYFYEEFLAKYNPKLRKQRGVYYTPQSVVNFIVRALDQLLQTEFNIEKGLADDSKIAIEVGKKDKNKTAEEQDAKIKTENKQVHQLQILDPATGTGTFLTEVIKQVHQKFKQNQGMWQGYVSQHLIPRLIGFELIMAAYAVTHLKIGLTLQETGFNFTDQKERLNVYLTNSLDEAKKETSPLPLNEFLTDEANEANSIKTESPVMVILGNPPYKGISSNNGDWIRKLIADYKKEPVSGKKLKEIKQWLDDDYVKFIRYGQHFIEKKGEGILAFINNNNFLDNLTFRGMRWNLLQTFDKIYILDLHGSSKKKETAPDGSKDENVFDIQVGVSINFFIKTNRKKAGELAQVYHKDLYGSRQNKNKFLWEKDLLDLKFKKLPNKHDLYYFLPKNFAYKSQYDKGFKLKELFINNVTGVVTFRDKLTIHRTIDSLKKTATEFIKLEPEQARTKFALGEDGRDWKVALAQADLKNYLKDKPAPTQINYRPFDFRHTYYTGRMKGFFSNPRKKVMQHFLLGENIGLVTNREQKQGRQLSIFISDKIIDLHLVDNGAYIFPLYIYHTTDDHDKFKETNPNQTREHNLNETIVNKIAEKINLKFTPEAETNQTSFCPLDLLDYIYAILHSLSYRKKYQEFLKIDFPKVPIPKDKASFLNFAKFGSQLRELHLLKNSSDSEFATFPISGGNLINSEFKENNFELDETSKSGKVWINKRQYFNNIPTLCWNFDIGGCHPAKQWLKDRKGRELSFDDIVHYQKIISTLLKTHQLMQELDKLPFE